MKYQISQQNINQSETRIGNDYQLNCMLYQNLIQISVDLIVI